MNVFGQLNDSLKMNFMAIGILTTIVTTSLLSSGITHLCILGLNDVFGWLMLGIPALSVLAIFVAFGCCCGYMFIGFLREYHSNVVGVAPGIVKKTE